MKISFVVEKDARMIQPIMKKVKMTQVRTTKYPGIRGTSFFSRETALAFTTFSFFSISFPSLYFIVFVLNGRLQNLRRNCCQQSHNKCGGGCHTCVHTLSADLAAKQSGRTAGSCICRIPPGYECRGRNQTGPGSPPAGRPP